MEEKDYGEATVRDFGCATVGFGTPFERKIKVIDCVQSRFKDNRVITVATLENNEGYILSVENLPSSGRATTQQMWLSEESLTGLMGAVHIFWKQKKMDVLELMKNCVIENEVHYSFSDNLK